MQPFPQFVCGAHCVRPARVDRRPRVSKAQVPHDVRRCPGVSVGAGLSFRRDGEEATPEAPNMPTG
eukprot:5768591-Lingulodinium_polyedra.AAC.1